MSAHVLVTGAIHRKPEVRKTKAGKNYCTTKIKISEGDDFQYWAVNAFDDASIASLMACNVDDLVSARGKLLTTIYHPEGGDPRINLTVSASAIVCLSVNASAAKTKAERFFKPKQTVLPFHRKDMPF
jgi:hypothetical protein